MDINKLNKRVTIQQNMGSINDGGGNLVPDWQPVAETWAGVKPANGYEQTIAEQRRQEVTHVVTMRYRADIEKAKHRILYAGRILNIEYIINVDEANRELKIQCREGRG